MTLPNGAQEKIAVPHARYASNVEEERYTEIGSVLIVVDL